MTAPTNEFEGDSSGFASLTLGYDHLGVRSSFMRAFRDAIDTARTAAASSGSDLAGAVHDFRKALRRARALLALIGRSLPKHENKTILEALREARRALSVSRDHAVAPGVIGALVLDDTERSGANEVLITATGALPLASEVETLLRDGAARAALQVDAIEAALPAINLDDVLKGLAATYRQARRARRRAKSSVSQFHRFRRRVKELSHQLDFLLDFGGPRTTAIRDAYLGISTSSGETTDFIMARDFLATYAGPRKTPAQEQLDHKLSVAVASGVSAQRIASKDLFANRRKKWMKRLARALAKDSRAEATPVEGNDPGDSD